MRVMKIRIVDQRAGDANLFLRVHPVPRRAETVNPVPVKRAAVGTEKQNRLVTRALPGFHHVINVVEATEEKAIASVRPANGSPAGRVGTDVKLSGNVFDRLHVVFAIKSGYEQNVCRLAVPTFKVSNQPGQLHCKRVILLPILEHDQNFVAGRNHCHNFVV